MIKRMSNIKVGASHLYCKFKECRKELIRSHHTLYAFIGGVGVVLFWHGIWEGLNRIYQSSTILSWVGHPAVSVTVGIILLAITGLFVFELVGREALALQDNLQNIQKTEKIVIEDVQNVKEEVEEVKEDVQSMVEEVESAIVNKE